jgi:hypothetical protein
MNYSYLRSGKFCIVVLLAFICFRLDSQITGTSHLPLIVIDTEGGEIPDDPKVYAWLKVIDNGPGNVNNIEHDGTDFEGTVGIEIRGQSSQMFPKKSYSFELRTSAGNDTTASLLGMPAEEDWILYAPYSDKTLLRNSLTYYLGRRMGEWQPRDSFCELYLNGEYQGIYVLVESVKRDSCRLDISKLKSDEVSGDDLTGGYIVKSDKTDGLEEDEFFRIVPSQKFPNSVRFDFTYVYPKYTDIVDNQKDYIRDYLTRTENAINSKSFSDPSDGFRKYIDVKSFVDFQIIQELTNNVDGYRFSTYFYKDKDSKGGKLHAGPLWDFDLGYGNEDFTDFNLQTDIWLYTKFEEQYGGRIHWWARLMDDLGYRSAFLSRWKELRKGAFSTDSIFSYIDNTIEYLGDAVGRNYEKWPIIGEYVWPNYFVGETYEEDVEYLKNWINERTRWIDDNILFAEGTIQNGSEKGIIVFPNPADEKISLYFHIDFTGDLKFEFFNLLGQKVFQDFIALDHLDYQYMEIDVSGFEPGYYILVVTQGKRFIGKEKIIVK